MVVSVDEKNKNETTKMETSIKRKRAKRVSYIKTRSFTSRQKKTALVPSSDKCSSSQGTQDCEMLTDENSNNSSNTFDRKVEDISSDLQERLSAPLFSKSNTIDSPILSTSSSKNDLSFTCVGGRPFTSESDSSDSTSLNSITSKGSLDVRRKRWWKTAQTLRDSGLLTVTMKTAELLRKNQQLQKDIESLQVETKNFVVSVLSNPENSAVLEDIGSHSQLYEMVVPGSQKIMSVSTKFTNKSIEPHDGVLNIGSEIKRNIRSPSLYSDASSPISSPNTGSFCSSSDEDTLFTSKPF